MRRTNWTPSIIPADNDQTVYLVAEDFGKLGRAWREADYEATDLETVIQDLLSGQYNNPIRVVAFNTAERWSEDVSEDVAHELAGAAIYRREMCHPPFKISLSGMRVTPGGKPRRYAPAIAPHLDRNISWACPGWTSRLDVGPALLLQFHHAHDA